MTQQTGGALAARYVPFPDDPRLPHDQRRTAVNVWLKHQMAIGAAAFGDGWAAQREWFKWVLVREAQARLAAMRCPVCGWPTGSDLREAGAL